MAGMKRQATIVSLIYGVLAIAYLAALALFLAHQREIADTIRRVNAGLTGAGLDELVSRAVIVGAGYHLLTALTFAGLAVGAALRGSWVRLAAPVILVLQVLGGFYDNAPGLLPAQALYINIVNATAALLQLVAIALLWRSRSGPMARAPEATTWAGRA